MLDFITWTADPAIFTIGSREIRWYGLAFAIGFAIGYMIVDRMWKKEKLPQPWIDSLLIYTMLGTVIGARLGHCLFYDPDYYLANPIEILKIWEGGLASHGVKSMGLDDLRPFNPEEKVIEYMIADKSKRLVDMTCDGFAVGISFHREPPCVEKRGRADFFRAEPSDPVVRGGLLFTDIRALHVALFPKRGVEERGTDLRHIHDMCVWCPFLD